MKFCPFCGSPAAAWPEYASDYVRGYPLCEYHMHGALKMATIYNYDDKVVYSEDLRVKYEKMLWHIIESWAESTSPGCMDDPDSHPILMDVFDRATSLVSLYTRPNYGDPISKRISDAEIDRWFALRITDLAKKGISSRCTATSETGFDKRCTNYATKTDLLCDQCRKSSSMAARAIRGKDKIDEVMRVLRDE